MAVGQLFEQGLGLIFVERVDAVADAFGVAEIDGLADVEAEAGGRDQTRGEFAGVERDVDLGVYGVEVVEHEHLAVILAHGRVSIFWLDEIDADYIVRVRGSDFKTEEGLGEDLLRWEGAKDLIEDADLDGTGGCSGGGVAVLQFTAACEVAIKLGAIDGDFIAEAGGKEFVAEGGEFSRGDTGDVVGF